MAGPNVNGMVNDPEFIKLSPADQRQALFSLTGDQSFSGLSDGDTLQFVSKMRGAPMTPEQYAASQGAPVGLPHPVPEKNTLGRIFGVGKGLAETLAANNPVT